jgi:hypothetical protein
LGKGFGLTALKTANVDELTLRPFHSIQKTLAAGSYDVAIELDPGASAVDAAYVDAVAESGTVDLGGRAVPIAEIVGGKFRTSFELKRLVSGVEIRLLVPGGFAGAIRRVTITERARGDRRSERR